MPPATDEVSIPSQVGTLFGQERVRTEWKCYEVSQYPLRWAPSSDVTDKVYTDDWSESQYPLRWAPSSDLTVVLDL